MEFLKSFFKIKGKEAPEDLAQISTPNESPEETLLRSREKKKSKTLNSSNEVIFLRLKDDGSAIFKPANGEVGFRKKTKEGTYFKRARAAYLVNEFLGFDLVPTTTIRKLDGKIGSIQRFIENARTYRELSPNEQEQYLQEHKEKFITLWLFDLILWNSDRHEGNLIVSTDDIHAIDNDLSFGDDHMYTLYTYYDTPIPQHLINKIERFVSSDDMKKKLKALLLKLLPKKEVDACFSRIKRVAHLIKKGVITRKEKSILETYF